MCGLCRVTALADGKVTCPTCGSEAVTWLPTRFLFQCKGKHPKRQFSVKVGTVFEDSPIPLGDWLVVAWMLTGCRNGISSYEVARTIASPRRAPGSCFTGYGKECKIRWASCREQWKPTKPMSAER